MSKNVSTHVLTPLLPGGLLHVAGSRAEIISIIDIALDRGEGVNFTVFTKRPHATAYRADEVWLGPMILATAAVENEHEVEVDDAQAPPPVEIEPELAAELG